MHPGGEEGGGNKWDTPCDLDTTDTDTGRTFTKAGATEEEESGEARATLGEEGFVLEGLEASLLVTPLVSLLEAVFLEGSFVELFFKICCFGGGELGVPEGLLWGPVLFFPEVCFP